MLIPCFIKKIVDKVDFEIFNEDEDIKNINKFVDLGCFCRLEVGFIKNYYIELFEDFEQLGKFVMIESNVVMGSAKVLKFLHLN